MQPNASIRDQQAMWIAVAALVSVVGAFLPWFSALGFSVSGSSDLVILLLPVVGLIAAGYIAFAPAVPTTPMVGGQSVSTIAMWVAIGALGLAVLDGLRVLANANGAPTSFGIFVYLGGAVVGAVLAARRVMRPASS